jgi:hypothetical protein
VNGPGHYALGATAGVVWWHVGGLTPWQALVAVPVAAGFSYAALSPDIDGSKLWHLADRVLPDEWLGNSGPMRHRGIAHWWGLYAALTWLVYQGAAGDLWWLAGAVLGGWWSHLLGDFLVGARGQGRGPGIPVFPWWGHVGLGAKCGGWTEATLAVLVPFLVIPWVAAWHVTGSAQPWTLVA